MSQYPRQNQQTQHQPYHDAHGRLPSQGSVPPPLPPRPGHSSHSAHSAPSDHPDERSTVYGNGHVAAYNPALYAQYDPRAYAMVDSSSPHAQQYNPAGWVNHGGYPDGQQHGYSAPSNGRRSPRPLPPRPGDALEQRQVSGGAVGGAYDYQTTPSLSGPLDDPYMSLSRSYSNSHLELSPIQHSPLPSPPGLSLGPPPPAHGDRHPQGRALPQPQEEDESDDSYNDAERAFDELEQAVLASYNSAPSLYPPYPTEDPAVQLSATHSYIGEGEQDYIGMYDDDDDDAWSGQEPARNDSTRQPAWTPEAEVDILDMPTPSAFYEGYSYPPAADHHDDGFGARPTGSSQQSSLRRSHASQSSQASGYGYSYGVPMDEYPAINRRPSFDEGDEEPLTRADDMVEPQDMASSLFPPSRPLPDVPGQNSLRSALRRPTSAFPFGETVNNAHMFRTTSLVSTHVPPQVEQPLRSRTNAEEPRRTQRSSYVPNFDLTLSTHASPLDLPTIGARKFAPGKLGAQDFKKCSEPWAMSGIMSWLAQTVSPEQYAELKEADVLEALVALFTHKVPTMNIADAEGLGGHFISQMYAQGRLVKSEEWVSIVSGKMEGVIYQLTGTGCYSPRLHEHVEPGRCYSRLCQRTLKKVNLQGPPAREMESWEVFYNLSRSDWENADKKELQRQNVLHEIVQTEERYMRQINVLRKLYRDQLANAEPSIITPERKTEFLKEVFGRIDAVKRANEDYLLPQLKYRQEEQGPWVVGFSDIFRQWIRKARTAYLDYAAGFPAANLLVRQELQRNLDFRAFIERASKDERSSRLQWDTYLKAPITRLQRYGLLLESVLKCMKEESTEKKELKIAWEEVKKVTLECDARVAEMQRKADLKDLATRLVLRPAIRESVKLNLDHYRRELVYRGDLQRNSEKKMAWLDSHVLLFDHYLVLAKLTDRRTYDVSRPPIPMDLLVLESTNEPLIQKSSYVRGITSVAAPGTSPVPTVMQNGPVTTLGESDKILYPFKIKHVGQHGHTYTLLASSENSRREWCQNIIKAKMKRAAALQAQNAEPFRLRIMADSAFAPPTMTTGLAGGKAPTIANTPLDRAIKETEQRFQGTSLPGPVCRARVNCATSFLVPQVGKLEPKRKVAVGTDFGVFVSDYDNLRGWRKAIQLSSVTQIAVLEDFNLFLLIAEKVLIAYHLDTICYDDRENVSAPSSTRKAPQRLSGSRDVGFFVTGRMKDRMLVIYKKRENLNSVFKVLEPIYQKTSSYQTSRFNLFRSQTEFFRDYDEFYIPTECSGVRIFRSSLSVATSRGFEVMTLEKKMPWTVPDTAPPHVAGIAAKIRNQRALTMLRLSDEEFLLVYTHCAIYMNQHGEINRSVQVDFEGAAQSATLYGDYLVLFDSNFVEIRNAHNGRLKQVVHGRDVRCLDDGSGEGGTVKFTMLHPDRADRTQLVLELVLNVM